MTLSAWLLTTYNIVAHLLFKGNSCLGILVKYSSSTVLAQLIFIYSTNQHDSLDKDKNIKVQIHHNLAQIMAYRAYSKFTGVSLVQSDKNLDSF